MGNLALVCVLPVIAVLSACSETVAPSSAAEWQGTIETTDGRTVVRNEAGSVWEGTRELVPDLVIGVAEGREEEMFGPILGLAVDSARVYATDYQVPAVRTFDHDGLYLGDIGRKGEGPGEYLEPDDVAVGPDGRVYVREPRRARIHVYSPAGEPETFLPLEGGLFTQTPMTVTPTGTVYAPQLLDHDRLAGEWTIGMVPHSPDGPLEEQAVVPTVADFEPSLLVSRREDGSVRRSDRVPFTPARVWAMAPSGAMIVGVTDEYTFEIRQGDGSVTEIHHRSEPAPVQDDEAEWHRRLVTSQFQRRDPTWQWDGSEVPSHKPHYVDFIPSRSGSVWVLREGTAAAVSPCTREPVPDEPVIRCWEPTWYADVFDESGRFMGTVEFPQEMGRPHPQTEILDDALWTVVTDDLGTITVRRYRLIPSPGEQEKPPAGDA